MWISKTEESVLFYIRQLSKILVKLRHKIYVFFWEPRRWVLTDAHCVCSYDGKIHMADAIRIRVPKLPWVDFPNDRKKYPYNAQAMGKHYSNILVDPILDIFVHPG